MKLSIITINLNNADGLRKTIDSVVSQSITDFEYIVIDGASTDGSLEVIQSYPKGISQYVSEKDSGIYNAMNKGLDLSCGEYLLFLNSGDFLKSNDSLEGIIDYLDGTDIVSGTIFYEESGNQTFVDHQDVHSLLSYYWGTPIPHQSTFIKRDLLVKNRYDESLKLVSDWKFFMIELCVNNSTYKRVDQAVAVFNEYGLSQNREKCLEEMHSVLRSMLPPGVYNDYRRFSGNIDSKDFVSFFSRVRRFSYSGLVYSICVLLVRFISLFVPSADFARSFPVVGKRH